LSKPAGSEYFGKAPDAVVTITQRAFLVDWWIRAVRCSLFHRFGRSRTGFPLRMEIGQDSARDSVFPIYTASESSHFTGFVCVLIVRASMRH
jgi:hypothetical protein